MARLLAPFFLLPFAYGIIFIDRTRLEFDRKFSNWSITYFHDQTGNSVVNISVELFDTMNKALFYIKANVAKDRNDKDCQIEMLNTVIDATKLLKGMQSHFLLRNILAGAMTSMKFDPKFPMHPVSCKIAVLLLLQSPFFLTGNIQFCQYDSQHRYHPI